MVRRTFIFAVVLAVGALMAPALAEVQLYALHVEATNDAGTAVLEIPTSALTYNAGNGAYFWSLPGATDLYSNTGQLVATLQGANLFYRADPGVSLGFAVLAGSSTTTFTLLSGLSVFPTIAFPVGQASAGLTLTETNGGTATLTGTGLGGKAYSAFYNGGTNFGNLHSGLTTTTSTSSSASIPSTSIGVPVSSLNAGFRFSVTSYDLASGTSTYLVTPEPASAMLLLLATTALLRRR